MISQFYENIEIFVTGGSGVVGKAIIEKLLRSCNVKKIYVLLRSKKGVNTADRLVELKNSRIFKVLKERKPNELDKLVAISGNICLDGLGISPKDRELLKNVSVFFHSAATTRFVEPLKSAIRLNVKATHEALKIAETMKNLKIFTHISTYFSNPYQTIIEDKVYPALFDWRTAIKLLDHNEDAVMDGIQNKVIDGFVNTYLFTKHLGEQVVNDYRLKLPVCIYKPSVVTHALQEPEPGFTETTTGAIGLMVLWGTGLVQSFHIRDPIVKLNMTPLDFGTKTLLIFTALKSQLPREKFIEKTPVARFSSITIANSTLSEHCNYLTKGYQKAPLEKSIWIPNVTVTTCSFIFWLNVIFLQLLPAYLMDIILILFRKKPFFMAIQRKMWIGRNASDFFLQANYQCDGVTDFEEMRKVAEGTEFCINFMKDNGNTNESITQLVYFSTYGCRKYIMNEPDSSIERCKRILKAKIIAYNVLKVLVALVIGWAIYRRRMAPVEN